MKLDDETIIKRLGQTLNRSFKKNHSFNHIFSAMASVVFAQAVNYLLAQRYAVTEENLIPVLQQFLNQVGTCARQALDDPLMQPLFNATKDSNDVPL